jgi:hypothetical protein
MISMTKWFDGTLIDFIYRVKERGFLYEME